MDEMEIFKSGNAIMFVDGGMDAEEFLIECERHDITWASGDSAACKDMVEYFRQFRGRLTLYCNVRWDGGTTMVYGSARNFDRSKYPNFFLLEYEHLTKNTRYMIEPPVYERRFGKWVSDVE